MNDPAVLRFALISGLIGFAAFCASYALHVWRRRNAAVSGRQGSFTATARSWSTFLIVAGALGIAIALAVRELDRPEGVLLGDGLFTVRAPDDDLRLAYLFQADTARKGDVVARLESPKAEAKVRELNLRCQRLEMERDALLLDPPQLDPELVRRYQNTVASRHQLRASVDQLLPACESVVRQATLERLARLEKSARLDVDIAWYLGELDRVSSRREHAGRELARAGQLAQRNAVAQSELDSCREQTAQLDAEIANLKQRIENLRKEKSQIDQGLREVDALAQQQQETLRTELDRAREDRAAAEAEDRRLAGELAEDQGRAGELRNRQLDQLRLKIEECRAELAGVEQALIVRAPFDGTVVYRDPSPRSANARQPLFVLGRQSGFRMRLRLPRAQAASLEKAGEVTIELVDPAVEPYFGGRFLEARAMPHKPGCVVAELACHPSRETVKELVEGEKVASRLLWRPPLTTLLPFRVGAVAVVLGMAAWLVTAVWIVPQRALRGSAGAGGDAPPPCFSHPRLPASGVLDAAKRSAESPLPCAAELESGSVAALLELLGARLREVILRGDVDDDLVAAVEWALDRHHVRAIHRLRAALDWDNGLAQRVSQLDEEAAASHDGNGNGSASPRADRLQRLLRVLRVVEARFTEPVANRC